jgi:biofilm protein TabA
MILGSMSSWNEQLKYENSIIIEAVEELREILQQDPDPGKVEIRGNEIYATIMDLDAKLLQEQLAEKHEMYIDVHYLIAGEETIGWSPVQEGTRPVKPYQAEEDYAIYAPSSEEVLLSLKPGMFAVFFPQDIHRPGMGQAGKKIKKAVIKIHIGLFDQ